MADRQTDRQTTRLQYAVAPPLGIITNMAVCSLLAIKSASAADKVLMLIICTLHNTLTFKSTTERSVRKVVCFFFNITESMAAISLCSNFVEQSMSDRLLSFQQYSNRQIPCLPGSLMRLIADLLWICIQLISQ